MKWECRTESAGDSARMNQIGSDALTTRPQIILDNVNDFV